jgi:hypothetical protein
MTIEQEIANTVDQNFKSKRVSHDEFLKQQRPMSKKAKRNWIIAGVVLALAWAYTGFMGPSALLSYPMVHEQCIDFAKRKEIFGKGVTGRIEARNMRIRHSSWVVDLYAYDREGDLSHRTCVVDGQTILLASMLQDWMYK